MNFISRAMSAWPIELNSKTLAEVCGHGTHENFEKAIQIISYYNVKTDLKHFPDAKYHFDNEEFTEGKKLIITGIENITKSIKNDQFDDARITLGKILHTLQDFYSHSNWIELGNTEPCTALINKEENIPNPADKAEKTCEENCKNGNCGAQFLDKILNEKILTSGYFGKGKPRGKCSHGGFLDLTTGIWRSWDGINKDYSDSSHGSRHKEAADVAITASVQLLEKIWENIDNQGGNKFLRLMGLHPTPPKGKWKPSFSIFHFKSRYPEVMDSNDDE
ncbi:von Willebrand factor A domain-containing protein 7-like [Sinocyclocheilus grahami]|uniref:von Willebrand factor A domain-containing protein 7-like n=1 Tax=Sinocyclocheilus grahami TaxID=75366 RepID=UPI0007AC5357|nr:PREDICTED: von Willebrand factor A domain-containing protein 7-like [Sinocyclocheilus grahami]